MFGVIQKHIKDGHFIGSDGVCIQFSDTGDHLMKIILLNLTIHHKLGGTPLATITIPVI